MANVFDRGNGEAIKLSDLSGDSIGALIAAISSADLGRFEETTTDRGCTYSLLEF
jgi:hypothetical protein